MFKLFDRVYIGDAKIPGIIVGAKQNSFLVDTILQGVYGVTSKELELMSTPKGILTLNSNIPEKALIKFRNAWNEQLKQNLAK